jgi:5-methylcytosine-specific restriction endonuclease McrA
MVYFYQMNGNCSFCNREKDLTFHHFIPKTLHTNKYFKRLFDKDYMKTNGANLCKDCHHTVHEFWTEKELGKKYNTKEKILNSEKFKKYLKWVVKQ